VVKLCSLSLKRATADLKEGRGENAGLALLAERAR
jgi:hypothetical protein